MSKIISSFYTIDLFSNKCFFLILNNYKNKLKNNITTVERLLIPILNDLNNGSVEIIKHKSFKVFLVEIQQPKNYIDYTNLVILDFKKQLKEHNLLKDCFIFNMNLEQIKPKSIYWFNKKKNLIDEIISSSIKTQSFYLQDDTNNTLKVYYGDINNLLQELSHLNIDYKLLYFNDNIGYHSYIYINWNSDNLNKLRNNPVENEYRNQVFYSPLRLKIENNLRLNLKTDNKYINSNTKDLMFENLKKQLLNVKPKGIHLFKVVYIVKKKKIKISFKDKIYLDLFYKKIILYNQLENPIIQQNELDTNIEFHLDIDQAILFFENFNLLDDNIWYSNKYININIKGSLKNKQSTQLHSEFEKFGFNQMGIKIKLGKKNKNIWNRLLLANFFFDLTNGCWIKNLASMEDYHLLKSLSIKETKNSRLRRLRQILEDDLFILPSEDYSNVLKLDDKYIKPVNLKMWKNKNVLIIIKSEKNTTYKSPLYEKINKIYIGEMVESKVDITLNWTFLKSDELHIINDILINNKCIVYNCKFLVSILLYNNIITESDLNKLNLEDILLQTWIYNPIRYNLESKYNNYNLDLLNADRPGENYLITSVVKDNCNFYKGYTIDELYEAYSLNRIDNDNLDKNVIYLAKIYFLFKLFNRVNNNIEQTGNYIREVKASILFGKIENKGIRVDFKNLSNLKEKLLPSTLEGIVKEIDNLVVNVFSDLVDKSLIDNFIHKKKNSNLTELFILYKDGKPTLTVPGLLFPETSFRTKIHNFSTKNFFMALLGKNKKNHLISSDLIRLLKLWTKYTTYRWVQNTYLQGLYNNVINDSSMHIIRPCIKVWVSSRGRIDTLFNNIHYTPNSKKTPLGKSLRRLFISRPGYTFLIADWSAQELATLGYLSGNQEFINAYNKLDLHSDTALSIFRDDIKKSQKLNYDKSDQQFLYLTFQGKLPTALNICLVDKTNKLLYNFTIDALVYNNYLIIDKTLIPLKYVKLIEKLEIFAVYITSKQRTVSKQFNFGAMYGRSKGSYAEDLLIPEEKIEIYLDRWSKKWKGINKFIESLKNKTIEDGYICTLKNQIGRRCFYPETLSDIKSLQKKGLFNAFNFVNSGTATDLLKSVIVELDETIGNIHNDHEIFNIVHTMHDEIVMEVKDEYIDEVVPMVNKIMTQPRLFDYDKPDNFTLKVDFDICKWWDGCSSEEVDNEYEWNFKDEL